MTKQQNYSKRTENTIFFENNILLVHEHETLKECIESSTEMQQPGFSQVGGKLPPKFFWPATTLSDNKLQV